MLETNTYIVCSEKCIDIYGCYGLPLTIGYTVLDYSLWTTQGLYVDTYIEFCTYWFLREIANVFCAIISVFMVLRFIAP